MKPLSIYSIRMLVVMITALTLALQSKAQVSNNNSDGSYLGKIQVYTFSMDSLYYNGTKRLSAVGKEYTADLFSSRMGDNTYFKIYIDDDCYAVLSNPFGSKVSSEYYYAAWIKKDGKYVSVPTLAYKAGSYFLALPFAQTDDRANTNTTASISSSSTTTAITTKQVDWQLMGKVRVVSDMRTTRSHGEEDVIYDEETAFLYSAFDGEKTKYKITIPKYGSQYDVYENGSYNGAEVHWDSHGKHIRYLPSLSQMFTHYAGSYYLNVDAVRH